MIPLFDPHTFSWVGTHILQLTVLIVLVGILTRTICQHRPHLCYLLWVVVLLKCWTPPLWASPTGIFSWLATPPTSQRATLERDLSVVADRAPSGERAVESPQDATSRAMAWNAGQTPDGQAVHVEVAPDASAHAAYAAVLLAGWISGVGVVLSYTAYRWQQLRSSRFAAIAEDGNNRLGRLYDEVFHTFSRPPAVKLQLVSAPLGPGVVGVLRPAIVLPTQLAAALTDDELRCVFAHELRHVARRDHWWVPLQIATNAVWWFHPGVWWLTRQLNSERERVCDEETIVRHGMTARDYVAVLLSVLEQKLATRSSGRVGISFAARQAKARVHHLIQHNDMLQGRTRPWQWAIAVVALFLALPGAALRDRAAAQDIPSGGDSPAVTSGTFRRAQPDSEPLGLIPPEQIARQSTTVTVGIHGVVRDQLVPSGQPIANATVKIVDLHRDGTNAFPRFETTTDGEGRFRTTAKLSSVDGGGHFYLYVLTPTNRPILRPGTVAVALRSNGKIDWSYSEGREDHFTSSWAFMAGDNRSRNDTVTAPATIGPIEIGVSQTREVRGRILQQGKPLANAEVRVTGFAETPDTLLPLPVNSFLAEHGDAALTQRTNEAGEWSFPTLPVDPLTLEMTHESLPQMTLTWTAEASDQPSIHDFDLPRTTRAHFQIADSEDKTPVDANVRLVHTGNAWEATFRGKGKESVEVSHFPGKCTAHITPHNDSADVRRVYLPALGVPLEIKADSVNRFPIGLVPACTVEFRVVDDATNAPVPNIRLDAARLDAPDPKGALKTGWNDGAVTDSRGVVRQYVTAPQIIQVQLSTEAESQGYDSIAAKSEPISLQPRERVTRTMRLKRITSPRLMRHDLRHLPQDQRDLVERYHERGIFVQLNPEHGPTVHVSHAWKGDVADLKEIAAMGKLRSIAFHSMSLVGPSGFEHPIRGRDNVLLSDAAVDALGNLQVKEVYFDSNALTDEGMRRIAQWQGVEDIVMTAPLQATSAGFAQLGKLSALRSLQISGTSPGLNADAIRAWQGLEHLTFVRMYYAGDGLENLPRQLYRLSLAETSDASLQNLDRLPHLAGLDAFGQNVTDAGMHAVARIKSLISLNLANTSVTDAGIRQLIGMETLEALELRSTKMTRDCVPHLLAMPSLKHLDVDLGLLRDEDVDALLKKGVKLGVP